MCFFFFVKKSIRLATHHLHVEAKTISPISEVVLKRFSDLPRALRVLGHVFRFFRCIHPKYKSARPDLSIVLSRDELNFVKGRLIVLYNK